MPMSDGESLEKRNLVNLAIFHKAKLRRIQKGASAVKLFSQAERRKLREYGILTFQNMTWGLSEKAIKMLERGNDNKNLPN